MTVLESFVSQHQYLSYLIIFLGMFVEADLFFLTATIFADQGHLNWGVLIGVGFVGAILGDMLWYYIGRYSRETRLGAWILRRFRRYDKWLDANFMTRYAKLVFFAKFIYYINRLFPFLAGWHEMEPRRFYKIHFLAGTSWLATMIVIGFGLDGLVNLVGPKWILERIWILVIFIFIVFILGDHLLKKFFLAKKLEK